MSARPSPWTALAAALVGALGCVPDLDTTGAIRCGAGGACPDGFRCVAERCCPHGAAPGACPRGGADAGDDTGAATDTSADDHVDAPPATCDPAAGRDTCGLGRECRLGVCCDVTAGVECPPGGIGSPCASAAECGRTPGATLGCLRSTDTDPADEYPRGACISTCDPRATPDPCGPLGVCYALATGGGACVPRCVEGRPCRRDGPGYHCQQISIGMNRVAPVCLPDCTTGADCGAREACYRPGRTCATACELPGDPRCPAFTQCSTGDGVCLLSCLVGCPVGYQCGGVPALCRAR